MLVRNSLIFGFVSCVAYLLSFAKSVLVSRYFGTSAEMDAFAIAILVPNLLGSLVMGTVSAGLVPALVKSESHGRQARNDTFRSSLMVILVVCCLGSVSLWGLAQPIMGVVASAFDSERLSLAVRLARLAAPLFAANVIYALASADLLSRRKYALVAAAPGFGTMLSFILIALFHEHGVGVLVLSLLAGTSVQAAIVMAPAWIATAGGRFTRWRDPHVMRVLAAQLPLLAASGIGVANTFIDQFMAAFLPRGNVSALNYATNLSAIGMQVVVMAMGWVALPDFSAMIATSDMNGLRRRIRFCMVAAAMLALPATLAVAGFGHSAIRIVFQHGRFDARSSALVYIGWFGYSLGLLPAAIGMIAVRVTNGLEDNWLLFRVGLVLLLVNTSLDYVLMRLAGLFGITLSTTLVYCLSCFLMYRALQQRVGVLLDRATASGIANAIAAVGVAAIPAAVIHFLAGDGLAASLIAFAVFGITLLLSYRQTGLLAGHGALDL
jgi:putative peptidoglycan lipid II flippase